MKLPRLFRRRHPKDPLEGIRSIPGIRVDKDPVEAIWIELGLATERLRDEARHKGARRARMRRSALAVAVASILIVAGSGGANALGVRVPVVDEIVDSVLGISDDDLGKFAPNSPPEGMRVRPGPGNASEQLEVPLGGGSDEVAGAAYVTVRGEICLAVAERGTDPTSRYGNGLGCSQVNDLDRRVTRASAFVSGVRLAKAAVVAGFADEDVEALSVTGPAGPLTVALSAPWAPAGIDSPGFRIFLAVSQTTLGGRDRLTSQDLDRELDPQEYDVEARLRSGRIISGGQ